MLSHAHVSTYLSALGVADSSMYHGSSRLTLVLVEIKTHVALFKGILFIRWDARPTQQEAGMFCIHKQSVPLYVHKILLDILAPTNDGTLCPDAPQR